MKHNDIIDISIVVPAYNEEGSVGELHEEIVSVMNTLGRGYEIIFIDDGSTDGTFQKLSSLSPIKIIRFRKNFGQTAALDAGIKEVQGTYIITMDGDGQNDPADIPRLIDAVEKNNLDVVSGWRKNRQDLLSKRFFSRCAAMLRKILINDGVHDSGCTLKIYKKECFEKVDLVGEMHRFIPALLSIKGFKIGEIVVNHRARKMGQTKYDWKRGIKGVLDIFSVWFWKKYASRPLHLFGAFGIFLILSSAISGVVVVYEKFFLRLDLSDTVLTELTLFGFVMGVQFIVFGLLADVLSKSYFSVTKDTVYDVQEIIKK